MCKVILNELFKHSLQKAPYHSLWQFKYEKYFSETSMATLNIWEVLQEKFQLILYNLNFLSTT